MNYVSSNAVTPSLNHSHYYEQKYIFLLFVKQKTTHHFFAGGRLTFAAHKLIFNLTGSQPGQINTFHVVLFILSISIFS